MEEKKIRFTINSSRENVPLVGMSVNRICRSLDLDDMECGNIELAVVEVLNNIIKHAYKNEGGKNIDIDLAVNETGIEITIRDSGNGVPPGKLEEVRKSPEKVASLNEGGRGLYILHSLMDRVDIEQSGTTNIWKLVKHF